MDNITLLELDQNNKKLNADFFKKMTEDYQYKFKHIYIESGLPFSSLISTGYVYYILKGTVIRYFIDFNGNTKALDIFVDDEIIGLASLNGTVPIQLELRALTSVSLAVIPAIAISEHSKEFYPVLYSNFQYAFSIFYLTWQHSLADGRQRIHAALITLCRYFGKDKTSEYYSLPPFITHQIISEFASVSRPYVTKVILHLVDQKIVSSTKKNIKVIDLKMLISLTPEYQVI